MYNIIRHNVFISLILLALNRESLMVISSSLTTITSSLSNSSLKLTESDREML